MTSDSKTPLVKVRWAIYQSIFLIAAASLTAVGADLLEIRLGWFVIFLGICAAFLFWAGTGFAFLFVLIRTIVQPSYRWPGFISSACLLIALLIAPVTFHEINKIHIDFRIHRKLYEEAVLKAIKGDFNEVERTHISQIRRLTLPPPYVELSATGWIELQERTANTVVIFVRSGFGPEICGYAYSSDGTPPFLESQCHRIQGADPNWFTYAVP